MSNDRFANSSRLQALNKTPYAQTPPSPHLQNLQTLPYMRRLAWRAGQRDGGCVGGMRGLGVAHLREQRAAHAVQVEVVRELRADRFQQLQGRRGAGRLR